MRFTLELFGLELDISFGPTADDEPDDEPCSLDGGTTFSTPVGFTRSQLPDWDDPGSYHTIDPGEDE